MCRVSLDLALGRSVPPEIALGPLTFCLDPARTLGHHEAYLLSRPAAVAEADSPAPTVLDLPPQDGPFQATRRTVRYARSWKKGARGVVSRQVRVQRDGKAIAATLVLPEGVDTRLPGWIALGGVSRKGRFHPQLNRFAEALASTGAAVLVPEIPEWRRLRVTPQVTLPTMRGCVDYLNKSPHVVPGRFGAIGFSFGAPGVAVAASQEEVAEHMAGVVLFGGYCSLDPTLECMLTGHHHWEGTDYSLSPDPYGRWVVASNHLTTIPGYEDAGEVTKALRRLADAASGQRISAWEPHHDQMIRDLRCSLPERQREVFDQFATCSEAVRPDREQCRELALKLGDACRRNEPLLDPCDALREVRVPIQVIHGHGDRLVPFTESLRLMKEVPAEAQRGATVTRLFNHSKDHAPESRIDHALETAKLFGALRQLISTV